MGNIFAAEAVGITAILTGFNGILMVCLVCYVSYLRITLKIGIGDGGNKVMRRGIRAHGNTVEHAVVVLPLLLLFELLGASDTAMWIIGGSYVTSRYLYGFAMAKNIMPLRQATAAVTYIVELTLAIWVIALAI